MLGRECIPAEEGLAIQPKVELSVSQPTPTPNVSRSDDEELSETYISLARRKVSLRVLRSVGDDPPRITRLVKG